ncbi:MAG: BACON domain-containing carbohydrate-binding protein, partial [Acidobacteriota bacterium]
TVSSLAFDPTNRDIAYATYTNFGNKHVWRTLNGGAQWQPIDGNGQGALPDIPVNCIIVDPTNPQRLYIGTDIGVYTSPDGGAIWAVENTGFANVPVEWLSVNSFGGVAHVFAFTRGRGAWRVPLGQVCDYRLSPASQTFDAMGGSGTVTVTASGGDCSWTVENNAPWITITSETPVRGNGVVDYTVAPNNEPNPRSATMYIAGQSFIVTQAGLAVSVSAASLVTGTLAPESIVTAFGVGMSGSTQIAGGNQLPINLAGTVLKVRDQAGNERPSPLFFVSPNQINYQLPAGTVTGPASVTIFKGNDKLFSCQINVSKVAPGFFTVDGSGRGIPAGQALRYRPSIPNSAPQSEPLFFIDASQRNVLRPIDLGADLGAGSDQVFLVLYGTGFRLRTSLANVTARIGAMTLPVLFAGPQGDYAGLDQVNIQIPRSLAGRGEVDLVLTVDGQQSNVVRISIK